MATYSEDFAGMTTGSAPTNFTNRFTTTDQTWTVESVGEAEDDRVFRFVHTASIERLFSFDDVDADADREDSEIVVRWRINDADANLGISFWVNGSGAAGSEDGYLVEYELAGLVEQWQLKRYDAGTPTDIGAAAPWPGEAEPADPPGLSPVIDRWYYCRFRKNGTALQFRIWHERQTEPTAWLIDETDADLDADGWVGVGCGNQDQFEIDYVGVGTAGDTAPIDVSTNTVVRITAGYAAALVKDDSTPVRITAAYAAALVTDTATPVRITAAYAAVLYSAPAGAEPPPAFIPAPKANRISFERELQQPLELNLRPETPLGFFAGQWPSHKPPATFKPAFKRSIQKLPELDEYPPTPVAQPLPAALTAFHVSFKRARKKLPELPAAPPTPPGFFEGHWPAPVPMPTHQTSFTRRLQKLPQLDQWTVTPPGFFAGQFPAAVRLKRIPVTYGRESQVPLDLFERPPTPPGFFEGHWPAPKPFPTHQTSFTRRLQTLAIPPVYPKTPVSAEDYGGYTRFPAENRIEYKRQIQPVLIPHVYPATPPGFRWPRQQPLAAFKVSFDRTLKAPLELDERPSTPAGFRWPRPPPPTLKTVFKRTLQKLPQLDEFEPTPPAFFEGFFPAPFRIKRIPLTYHRESQVPLQLDERPETPVGFFAGQWPAQLTLRPFTTSFSRDVKQPLELDEHPATPFGFQWGFYPGSKRVEVLTAQFTRTLQVLAIPPVYPKTPVSAVDYPALTPVLKANKVAFKRTLQTLELNEYPPTPPRFFEGFFPAPFRVKRIAVTYGRESQVPLELDERPPTPVGFFDGFWPGSRRVVANRTAFARRLQTPLEIDRYPETPKSPAAFAGHTPVPTIRRRDIARRLQILGNPHVYPPTPFGFQWGFYPGSKRVESNRVSFKRTIQPILNPHVYPATPPGFFAGQFPAPIRLKRIPVTYHRKALVPLDLFERPQTPPGFFAGQWPSHKPPPTFKTEFKRQLAKLPQHDQWTVTPPGFFEGQYPAAFRVDPHKVSFKRRLQPVILSRYQPIAVEPAYRLITAIRRRGTKFKPFAPNLLQLSRVHPPSFIIGDARWAMRAIYRRDIHRVLQPVWDPSAMIGEGFRFQPPDCRWIAPCQPIVWIANPDCVVS